MSKNPNIAIPVVPDNSPTNSIHQPQEVSIVINEPIVSIENPIKEIIYSRAKVVKFLTIIDMVFLTINFIISIVLKNIFWLFALFLPLCYCGYKGSKDYMKNYLIPYICYLTFMTVIYILLTFYYNSFFILLISLIEIYFLFYTSKLYTFLKNCPDEIINILRDGWNPNNISYYYY